MFIRPESDYTVQTVAIQAESNRLGLSETKVLSLLHAFTSNMVYPQGQPHCNVSRGALHGISLPLGCSGWEAFERVHSINKVIAVDATQFTSFRLAGRLHLTCGCSTRDVFLRKVMGSLTDHLHLFCTFVQRSNLTPLLECGDYAGFVTRYLELNSLPGFPLSELRQPLIDRLGRIRNESTTSTPDNRRT